jgi:hypothetical protein
MEKLLNLLQEFYWENRKFSDENWLLTMTNWVENLSGAYAQTYIISKQGWFIKWLVENDKIERPEIRSQWYTKPTYWYTTEPYTTCKSIELANTVLMILSIQDKPIEFLISILKNV